MNNGSTPENGGGIPAHLQGERRDVTVLFVDLSDFTEISSHLGPEGTHGLITRFYAVCDEIILDHGGTIDKHIGDEVMALFGAPVAHPDDPFRAVLCAAEIQAAMQPLSYETGIDIRVHAGLAHGEVIASAVGRDAREYMVIGDTVNLAARLKSLANAGESVLSEDLRDIVQHRFETVSLGMREIRGVAGSVEPFLLTASRHDQEAPPPTAFVNRKSELETLRAVLKIASQDQKGSLVSVSGNLGIGKTRLANAFHRHADKLGYLVLRESLLESGMESGTSALGQVLGSLLKNVFGADAPSVLAAQKDGGLSRDDAEIVNLIYRKDPQFGRTDYQSSLTFDSFHARVGEIFVKLVNSLLDRQPVILIVENLRPDQIDVLMPLWEIAATFHDRQFIVMATSRRAETFAGWPQDIRPVRLVDMPLSPFTRRDAIDLYESIKPGVERSAVDTIIDAAAGNPFVISLLAEQGVDGVAGETTAILRNLVLSKIDHLPVADRWGLICASVLGEYFELNELRRLAEQPSMDCSGYIRHKLIIPFRQGFRFISNLVRDIAYDMLLADQRRALHAAAAKIFQDIDPDLFARHLSESGDPAAFEALMEVATRNMGAFQYPAAIQNLEAALALPISSDSPFAAMLLLAKCRRGIGDVTAAQTATDRAIEAASTMEDRYHAHLLKARLEMEADRYQPSLGLLARCEDYARELGSAEKLAEVHSQRGSVLLPMDEPRQALQQHERALHFVDGSRTGETQVRVLRGAGLGHYHVGRMQTAHECFDKAVVAAESKGFLWGIANTLNFRGHTKFWLGDLSGAAADAKRAIGDAERLGEARAQMNAHRLAAFVELESCNPAAARRHAEISLDLTDRLGVWRYRTLVLGLISKSAYQLGDHDDAQAFADRAVAEISDADNRYNGPITLGLVARAFNRGETRRGILEDSVRRLRDNTIAHNHLWFYTDAIEMALETGDITEALRFADRLGAITEGNALPMTDLFIRTVAQLSEVAEANPGSRSLASLLRNLADLGCLGLHEAVRACAEHHGMI